MDRVQLLSPKVQGPGSPQNCDVEPCADLISESVRSLNTHFQLEVKNSGSIEKAFGANVVDAWLPADETYRWHVYGETEQENV
jgi:hypothetical protein